MSPFHRIENFFLVQRDLLTHNTMQPRNNWIFERFHYLNYSPKLFFGDGYKGSPLNAPFDKILVTCGAPEIPQELLKQLKVNGIMVIPVGEGKEQKMLKIIKQAETSFSKEEFGTFKFVPMLERTVK